MPDSENGVQMVDFLSNKGVNTVSSLFFTTSLSDDVALAVLPKQNGILPCKPPAFSGCSEKIKNKIKVRIALVSKTK